MPGRGWSGWGGQGRLYIEVKFFVKIKKKKTFLGGGGRVEGREVGLWFGVRVDVNVEVKFL